MQTIPVPPDHTLALEADQWRLVQDQAGTTLIEATAHQIKFHEVFLQRYPDLLPNVATSQALKVVVGWIPEAQSWQVGLFLPASSGTLTLCEVATWNGQTPHANESVAKMVGQHLSSVMGLPLQIVERDESAPVAPMPARTFELHDTQPSAYTRPLVAVQPRPLPLIFGHWRLIPSAEGLMWQLTGQWVRRMILRTGFFLVGALIFYLLGIGSLQSGLADVSPAFLPWIAFGLGALLLVTAGEHAWQLLGQRQVVLDKLAQEIRSEGALTGLVSWRVPFDSAEYLLVSQEHPRPQGRRSSDDPMQIAQDLWIHLYAQGRFYLIADVEDSRGQSWYWEAVRRHAPAMERLPLELSQYDSAAHHAALHTAQALDCPIYIDIR
jgi:hypothetical protein